MSIAFIVGSDAFQRERYLIQWRSTLRVAYPMAQHQHCSVKNETAWATLQQSTLFCGDLFSDQRLLEITLENRLPTTALPFLNALHQDKRLHCLLLVPKTEWVKQPQILTLLKQSTVYWARPLNEKELLLWIKKEAKQRGIKLAYRTFDVILYHTKGVLLEIHQLLEKLRLLKQGVIYETDILPLVGEPQGWSVFDWIDQVLSGQLEKVCQILTTLQKEGTEPQLLLWAITRELRHIIHIAYQLQDGEPIGVIAASLGIKPHRIPYYQNIYQKIPLKYVFTLLRSAQSIDDQIKGAVIGDPYEAILDWCIKLGTWLNSDLPLMA